MNRAAGLTLLLAVVAGAGCGPRMYPVTGKVVFRDGAPLTWGLVIFDPLEAKVKTSARGHVQKDGSFYMSTEREEDGVPEGRYRVMVAPLIGVPGASGPGIHARYQRPDTSPLEYTVVPGRNEATFEIDRPGGGSRKGMR